MIEQPTSEPSDLAKQIAEVVYQDRKLYPLLLRRELAEIISTSGLADLEAENNRLRSEILGPGISQSLIDELAAKTIADLEARLAASDRACEKAQREKISYAATREIKLLKKVKEASEWAGPAEDQPDVWTYLRGVQARLAAVESEREGAQAEWDERTATALGWKRERDEARGVVVELYSRMTDGAGYRYWRARFNRLATDKGE